MNTIRNFWKKLGPGLVTGAADDDPSGVATYSQAGASYGFQFLWVSLFSFPLMAIVQEMCGRIGIVTGAGLAENMRTYFSKKILYVCVFLLLCANTFNIGADLAAMAEVSKLLFPSSVFVYWVIFFAIFSGCLQVIVPYKTYSFYIKYLSFVLLSYVAVAFMIEIDWREVFLATVLPEMSFTKEQIILLAGILGTTISPYLFFWEPSQEVEEEIQEGKRTLRERRQGPHDASLRTMRVDVWSGMFFSNCIMFFIIAVCGATLYTNGIHDIRTAGDAVASLRPIAGDYAALLFALGIVGTGLLAIPVLAGSSAYAIAEAYKWREGLAKPFSKAKGFYGVILFSTFVGVFITMLGIDPMKALFYSAIVNCLVAPVMLVCIVLLASDRNVMGNYTNTTIQKVFGWSITVLMALASIATLYVVFFA